MTCYFDTSALVKLYHRESGTDATLEIYGGGGAIQISELARVETTAMNVTLLMMDIL